MKKLLTNDKMLMNLVKEVNQTGYASALLRERLIVIAEQTIKAVKQNPEEFKNPVFPIRDFVAISEIILKHLQFKKD